jgi:hypothetical protein
MPVGVFIMTGQELVMAKLENCRCKWKDRIKWSKSCGCGGYAAELVDLNKDGTPEILYAEALSSGIRLNALNGNGSSRWVSLD